MQADTSTEASDRQAAIQRQLGGPKRLLLAFEMSLAVRELAFARLRSQNPDYSQAEIVKAYLRELLVREGLTADLP